MSAKIISVVLLVLLAIYGLSGFLIAPLWLENELPERLNQHMGWKAEVENIRVNPFAMSIEARNLKAEDSDGEPVASFERLYVNLGVLKLFTGIIELEDVELASPFARLDLRQDNSVNFARDWQANNPSSDSEPEAGSDADPSEPPKVYLGRLEMADGELLFRDFRQTAQGVAEGAAEGKAPNAKEFHISPLDISLNDLATWPREDRDSDHYLQAAIGSQTVEWEGSLSMAPLYSRGSIQIADVSHETLRHFLEPYLPYALEGGTLTVSSDYEMRSGQQFSLNTFNGEVTAEGAVMALPVSGEDGNVSDRELLTSGRIHIPDIAFGLIGRRLSVGTVEIDETALTLERDAQGRIRLLMPFASESDGEQKLGSPAAASPFRWSVAGIELRNSRVNWRDEQPSPAADIGVQNLNVSLGRLSDELADPVEYKAELALLAGGVLNMRGQATLQPFTLEAGVSASDLLLAQFDPYLADVTNLTLRDGLLSMDGNLDMDNQQDSMTGTFSGIGEVSALDLRLGESEEPVLAWKNLRLEPLEYNIAPSRLEIGTITLSNPDITIVREQSGLHNFARIMPASESPDESAQITEDAARDGTEQPDFIFRIGQITLDEGVVVYADRTVTPAFSTRLDQLSGSLTGLSNVSPQQGKVSLQGRIGDVGSVKFDGLIGTLGTDETSDLNLKVDGVSLPVLSPYLSPFLGYNVDSGKLNLDLAYKVSGAQINADNQILLDRMTLGGAVPGDTAVNAPIKLGLALLRDGDGVIDINLPILGNLDDPEFRIGRVVMNTFVNLIAKAATSPFSVLGSLADMTGLSGEELGQLAFEPGKTSPPRGGREKLEVLSDVLSKRPSLLLKVRGAVSPEADGGFLRRQRLLEQLAISESPTAPERIARLEAAYQDEGLSPPLATYRAELTDQGGSFSDLAWEKALVNQLSPSVQLAPEVMGDLASARGVWLRNSLQQEYGVADDQLFLLAPLQSAQMDANGDVLVNFQLEVR